MERLELSFSILYAFDGMLAVFVAVYSLALGWYYDEVFLVRVLR